MSLIDRIMEYVWIMDDDGIVDGDRPQRGRVRLMHNPEQIERLLFEEKLYSTRPCPLCGERRTRYAKLKGGFQLICESCRELCNKAGLLEAEHRVVPMAQ